MVILVADDDDYTREGIVESIAWAKYGIGKVLMAQNGEEALGLTEEWVPDIVLTDIRMPKMDGITFVNRLIERRPACKIILMSGYLEIGYLKQAISMSAVDFIEKPISIEKVTAALSKAVDGIHVIKAAQSGLEYDRKRLLEVLASRGYGRDAALKLCKSVGFPTKCSYVALCVRARPLSALKEAHCNVPSFILDAYPGSLIGDVTGEQFLALVSYEPGQGYRLGRFYRDFLAAFGTLYLGVGIEAPDLGNTYNSFQTACYAADMAFYAEDERLFFSTSASWSKDWWIQASMGNSRGCWTRIPRHCGHG